MFKVFKTESATMRSQLYKIKLSKKFLFKIAIIITTFIDAQNHDRTFSYTLSYSCFLYTWTVVVVSSYPPWKDGNARFTAVPLKALSDQVWIRYRCFSFFKLFFFIFGFSTRKRLALRIPCLWEATEKLTIQ